MKRSNSKQSSISNFFSPFDFSKKIRTNEYDKTRDQDLSRVESLFQGDIKNVVYEQLASIEKHVSPIRSKVKLEVNNSGFKKDEIPFFSSENADITTQKTPEHNKKKALPIGETESELPMSS
ncbi:hypothetical protein BB560_005760, partial [Smittium megazygosporum]